MKLRLPLLFLLGACLSLGTQSATPKKTEKTPYPKGKGYNIQMQEDQIRGTELDKKRRIQKQQERDKKLIEEAEKAMNDEVDF